MFSSGESTTFNGTPGTALSSLGTLAVVSNAGMPASGSGIIQTTIAGGSPLAWQPFSYTGLGTNTLTGCTYIGPQNSTVAASAPVLVGSQIMIAAPGGGGSGGIASTTGAAAAINGVTGLYAAGFGGVANNYPFAGFLSAGTGGAWDTSSRTLPAPGAIGAGAGGGQAGQCAGGTNGGVGGRPGSFSYTQVLLGSGSNSVTGGGSASDAAATDYGAGGGGGGGTRVATVQTGGAGGKGGPGVAIIKGPLV